MPSPVTYPARPDLGEQNQKAAVVRCTVSVALVCWPICFYVGGTTVAFHELWRWMRNVVSCLFSSDLIGSLIVGEGNICFSSYQILYIHYKNYICKQVIWICVVGNINVTELHKNVEYIVQLCVDTEHPQTQCRYFLINKTTTTILTKVLCWLNQSTNGTLKPHCGLTVACHPPLIQLFCYFPLIKAMVPSFKKWWRFL